MSQKLLFLLFALAFSAKGFGYETSNLKDSCALTLRALNVIKISKSAPFEITPLPITTKIDIFSNLAKLDPVKPLLSVKLHDREVLVAIRDMLSIRKVDGIWVPINHNNQTDFIVRFTDGTQSYLSEIKSIQLAEWPSVQIVISNPLKTARFVFRENDKIEDVLMRLGEGNAEAVSFLMDVVADQMKAMESDLGLAVTEEDQQQQINQLMIAIAGYNIGGEQLVTARDLFSGTEEDRANEFIHALFFEPQKLVDGINNLRPGNYPHFAEVPPQLNNLFGEF